MGLFRTGLMACLVVGSITFAQQPAAPVTPAPAPTPGIADPNAPAPVIPQPEPTPGVDPNLVQPAPPQDTQSVLTGGAANGAKPKPKKPVAPAAPMFRGTLASIDKTNMTIVVHGKAKDETLSITSKTRIFADNKPAILSDAKEGENVTVEYHTTKEKTKEALTLRFTGGGGGTTSSGSNAEAAKANPEHKKAEVKPAAKKSTKATAAAKKKKKPATPVDSAAPAPADTGVTPLPDATAPAPTTPVVPPPTPGTPVTNP